MKSLKLFQKQEEPGQAQWTDQVELFAQCDQDIVDAVVKTQHFDCAQFRFHNFCVRSASSFQIQGSTTFGCHHQACFTVYETCADETTNAGKFCDICVSHCSIFLSLVSEVLLNIQVLHGGMIGI